MLHLAESRGHFWRPVLPQIDADIGVEHIAGAHQRRLLFERVLGYANHLGLYAEQTGSQGEALRNFPQAFTRLALISAAFNLDRTLGSQV